MRELWQFELAPVKDWELTDFVDAYRGELPGVSASWLEAKGGIVRLEDLLLDAGHYIREVSAVTIDLGRWDSFNPITYGPIAQGAA